MIALLLLTAIVFIKASMVQALCARADIEDTEKEQRRARRIALIACAVPALGTAVMAALCTFLTVPLAIPLGIAMANGPVTGDIYSAFGNFALFLPLYFAWLTDFIITAVCWTIYKDMKINPPFTSACLAYVIIVIFEYTITGGAVVMANPAR